MATQPLALPDVKTTWSTIDATTYGPYREALQMRLILRLWHEDALRQEFLSNPKAVLERESHLKLPADTQIKVLEDTANLFHFVLPQRPPEGEFAYRFQQIADWWMMAHSLIWWQMRSGADLATLDHFRQGIHVMIIGRAWKDPQFVPEMQQDAKARLAKEIGATFPDYLTVVAPVDTPTLKHFVIPKRPQDERLIEQSDHLAGWFATAHALWWSLVCTRLLTPLPEKLEDKIYA
ncbi:NHLP leader peptide family natural product precursor [Oculatella sp. FACHB-28]|uniref:NHLP leader peptide family RiPP precursor n=1 Tax=Oculatella sp. FACHB-28 TaxID=2692845 RepID=UPI00168637C7|nr:NHLP leader peptide family RiPP precursor [Oculatella sp. FACHB-28]MBD2060647.1 NHLP leader peptide family natural product precursor [Oculatella sp. FACHB-28]